MNIENVIGTAIAVVTQVGLRIVGAFVLWLGGRRLIRLVIDPVSRAPGRQQVDVTVSRYLPA
jgi:hypothetical protein